MLTLRRHRDSDLVGVIEIHPRFGLLSHNFGQVVFVAIGSGPMSAGIMNFYDTCLLINLLTAKALFKPLRGAMSRTPKLNPFLRRVTVLYHEVHSTEPIFLHYTRPFFSHNLADHPSHFPSHF